MDINPMLEKKINEAAIAFNRTPDYILNSALTLGIACLILNKDDVKILDILISRALE